MFVIVRCGIINAMDNKQIIILSNYLNGQANLPTDLQSIADTLKELLIQEPDIKAEVLQDNEQTNG